jgi:hypothetical protein
METRSYLLRDVRLDSPTLWLGGDAISIGHIAGLRISHAGRRLTRRPKVVEGMLVVRTGFRLVVGVAALAFGVLLTVRVIKTIAFLTSTDVPVGTMLGDIVGIYIFVLLGLLGLGTGGSIVREYLGGRRYLLTIQLVNGDSCQVSSYSRDGITSMAEEIIVATRKRYQVEHNGPYIDYKVDWNVTIDNSEKIQLGGGNVLHDESQTTYGTMTEGGPNVAARRMESTRRRPSRRVSRTR